ncbi:MAG: ribosome silencing factor [Bacteroidaceae bacterium]|nr:ribosome silencing factor [Bacteroidaceae bacterium]
MEKGNKSILDAVVDGLQAKKGKEITIVDLSGISDCICRYFVICTGGSPLQVQALARSVGETVRDITGEHPIAVAGMERSHWVAMDYAEGIIHIMLPEERAFYDIEHLWADAALTTLPDME